jgi:polyhydroxyalkanoate synthase
MSTDPAFSQMDEWLRRLMRGAQAWRELDDVEIGSSTKQAIYQEDKLTLYRYEAISDLPTEQRISTPLLITYALVNSPYMMDLQPDRSLIRGLLARGIDVYLIDWGYPDGADRFLELKDYVLRYLPNCVQQVCQAANVSQVNLLGVCQGGSLSLCYAATEQQRIRNLITMVTPVDFRVGDNLLTRWSDGIDIDTLVASLGNVPGEMLNAVFLAQMPYRLLSQKYVAMLDQDPDPRALENFLRMEKWIFDSPDHPGEMFRQFINWLVKENRLVKGSLQIADRPILLQNIRVPVLNIYAERDHLVPPVSSQALRNLIGTSDYTEYGFQGGHIGIYVSTAAQREVPERIADWLRARDAPRG